MKVFDVISQARLLFKLLSIFNEIQCKLLEKSEKFSIKTQIMEQKFYVWVSMHHTLIYIKENQLDAV